MKLLLLFISLSCFSQKNMVKIEGFNGQEIEVSTPYTLNDLGTAEAISNTFSASNADIEINADYSKIYTILVDGKVRQYSIL